MVNVQKFVVDIIIICQYEYVLYLLSIFYYDGMFLDSLEFYLLITSIDFKVIMVLENSYDNRYIFLSYFDDYIMFYYASLLFTLLIYDSNSSKLIFMFFYGFICLSNIYIIKFRLKRILIILSVILAWF